MLGLTGLVDGNYVKTDLTNEYCLNLIKNMQIMSNLPVQSFIHEQLIGCARFVLSI